MFRFVLISLFGIGIVGCATPNVDGSFAKVFGEGTTISANGGGDVWLFTAAAREIQEKGQHIQIDGRCMSACAIFADKARPNVCVTENASFGFHKLTVSGELIRTPMPSNMKFRGRSRSFVIREDPVFSADIAAWVAAHGGFPTKGMLTMNAATANAFWPMCK